MTRWLPMTGRLSSTRPRPAWLWWTGGKDTTWALHVLRENPLWNVGGLVAAVNRANRRSAFHGQKEELFEQQADAVGLPLRLVEFDWRRPSREFDVSIQRVLADLARTGVEVMAYGDLFSSCARTRRSVELAGTGLAATFPLWGVDTRKHAETMLEAGLSAWVCSTNTYFLPAHQVGRRFDGEFLAGLPDEVDPCGENGEFHTFVEWAPGWTRRLSVAPVRSTDLFGHAFTDLERRSDEAAAPPPLQEQHSTGERLEETNQSGAADYDPFTYFGRLQRVRKHVVEHIQEDLTMERVARVAAMTGPAFGRFFRRHVGMRFGVWLAKERIDHACRLLRKSDASVSQIGSAAGFGSERSFRRAFREHTGINPSRYKKLYLSDQRRGRGAAGSRAGQPAMTHG